MVRIKLSDAGEQDPCAVDVNVSVTFPVLVSAADG